jgi:hypothetical protein
MKLTKVTRGKNADEQRTQAEDEDVGCHSWIESTDMRNEQIRNDRVEESPDNIDRCRGEPFAGWFCKWTLKGASHRAGNKMWDGVCSKSSPKEVRNKAKPIHDADLLFSG